MLNRLLPLLLGFLLVSATDRAQPAEAPVEVRIDCARPEGQFRALHGINKGPLGAGGLLDLTEAQRALGVPFTRLHDCHWPNPDVVDIHAVFPDPAADPELPESYDFRLTDEYVAATRATGARIIYRLGESIEHTSVKRFVHPPKDADRWAKICLGIIRHYNEGWAGGYRYDLRYWEIWNEPENRPSCWTGTDEQYFELYRVASRAIKARFPDLKVGGPAVGYSGELEGDEFRPGAFVRSFLDICRKESLPLDFFSWHCYTSDPQELSRRARGVRKLLDGTGFRSAESHLNEWNYLPDGKWDGAAKTAAPEARRRFYERMAGEEGAAFLAASLIELQRAPVEVAALFHGEVGGFGLFTEHGAPTKSYHALRAFRMLLDTPLRVTVEPAATIPITVAAGVAPDRRSVSVLVSFPGPGEEVRLRFQLQHLPWPGATKVEAYTLDREADLAAGSNPPQLDAANTMLLSVRPRTVLLIRLSAG